MCILLHFSVIHSYAFYNIFYFWKVKPYGSVKPPCLAWAVEMLLYNSTAHTSKALHNLPLRRWCYYQPQMMGNNVRIRSMLCTYLSQIICPAQLFTNMIFKNHQIFSMKIFSGLLLQSADMKLINQMEQYG